MKSRMKGDFHVRFCGNVGVKFPCVTRLSARGGQRVGLFKLNLTRHNLTVLQKKAILYTVGQRRETIESYVKIDK